MAFDWTTLIGPAVSAVFSAGGVGGFWAFHAARVKVNGARDAEHARANAAAPAMIMEGLSKFADALRAQQSELVDDLKGEINSLRTRVDGLEKQNVECQVENRQMAQRIESLEAYLRRNGIAVPESRTERTFTVMEEGRTTVLRADPVRKTRRKATPAN
jgi:hypothetical protein